MRNKTTLVAVMIAASFGSGSAAVAQDGLRHGRVRFVEPGVTIQRDAEPTSEETYPNSPFFPGDRIWTDGTGRAEFQFPDGSVLRLDTSGKLDYVARDDSRDDKIVLKLWSGSVYLRTRGARGANLEIETPTGIVEALDRGVYRVDVDSGDARLSVYEGEATLDSVGRRVAVEAGERAYARHGGVVERPRRFDRRVEDEFASWDRGREGHETWADGGRRYLPDELDAYSGELDANGAWSYETAVGYVWRPHVGVGWRPYSNGHWSFTPYGWTWVSDDAWGWAPFHFGRWGLSSAGWYWIPGRVWGPAWVSWAAGGEYVGWSPLGFHDRPLYAWPAGSVGFGARGPGAYGWAFVRRADMGARNLARLRVERGPADLAQVHLIESPHARPTRDLREFRVVEGGAPLASPRNVRTKMTPGDTVPELQVDRSTTIPIRRPRPNAEGVRRDERHDGGVAPAGDRAETKPERDADHDVLGRMFRPLSEPRDRPRPDGEADAPPPRNDGSSDGKSNGGEQATPREERTPPRAEPAHSAPPPRTHASPRPTRSEHKTERKKE